MSVSGYELDIFEDHSPAAVNQSSPHLHVTYYLTCSYGYHYPAARDLYGRLRGRRLNSPPINGKLVASAAQHSPYTSATYDAINHGFGTAPLYVCLRPAGYSEDWPRRKAARIRGEYVRPMNFARPG